jgi:hypothetical protein
MKIGRISDGPLKGRDRVILHTKIDLKWKFLFSFGVTTVISLGKLMADLPLFMAELYSIVSVTIRRTL